jgi:hypothetical protein
MSPRFPSEEVDGSLLGEVDESLDRGAERHNTEDPIDILGPPVRDDGQPSARPPPSATTEPEPRGTEDN